MSANTIFHLVSSLVLSFDTDSLSAMIMGTRAVNETSRKFTMSEEGPYLGPYRKIYEDIMSQRYSWVIKICSLVFFNYSALDASIFKSLCPLLREVPEDSKTPTCKVWMILCHVIAIERKLLFSKIDLIWISSVCATLLLAILSAKFCANFASWGCFGILRVFLSITQKSFSKNGQ